MKKLTTIQEVADASNIGKCLRFDTLLKINPVFWPAWGIELDPKNPEIRKAAIAGYRICRSTLFHEGIIRGPPVVYRHLFGPCQRIRQQAADQRIHTRPQLEDGSDQKDTRNRTTSEEK